MVDLTVGETIREKREAILRIAARHGTTEVRNLGRPASHGCVRLHPDNAKIFFKLVQASGKTNAQVAIIH